MQDFRKMIVTLWQGLSAGQRATLIGSFVGSLAVLVAVVHFASQPRLTLLYAGLAPAEAAKVVEFLQARGTPHELKDGGTAIHVPGAEVHGLRLALAAAGVPRVADTAGGVGFELFDRPSFGLSDFMQRANYYRALQGELARTIEQLDEVSQARVLIVVPEERLFERQRREAKASVFLRLEPGRRLRETQVEAVRFLVANGVAGLAPDNVAVIDNAGRALAETEIEGGPGGAGPGLTGRQLEVVRAHEENLREKAQTMLDQVLGPGEAVVRVSVDMSFDAVAETTERFDPRGQVPRSETTTSETSTSQSQMGGGTAGVAANVAGGGAPAAEPRPSQTTQTTRETIANTYEINRTTETRQRAAGSVRRVTAAVLINTRRPPAVAAPAAEGAAPAAAPAATPRTPQELRALEDLIKAAVGYTESPERRDLVTLQEVEFADLFAGEGAPGASVPLLQQATRWMPYASQALLGLLAVGLFLYFRSVVKTAKAGQESREFTDLLQRYESATAAQVEAANAPKNRNFTIDEMQKILREHPGNTAVAIKTWLGRN